jgi:hypothetical protein
MEGWENVYHHLIFKFKLGILKSNSLLLAKLLLEMICFWLYFVRLLLSDVIQELTRSTCITTGPHQLFWCNLVLAGNQLVDCIVIFQEHLHANERFPSLLCQHVPWLWSSKKV